MVAAYVCTRCDGCERLYPYGRTQRLAGQNYCTPCGKRVKARRCPQCGHGELEFHTALGCLYDDNGADCPCGPPAIEDRAEAGGSKDDD